MNPLSYIIHLLALENTNVFSRHGFPQPQQCYVQKTVILWIQQCFCRMHYHFPPQLINVSTSERIMRHNGIHSVTIPPVPIDLADVLLSSADILLLFARRKYIVNYVHLNSNYCGHALYLQKAKVKYLKNNNTDIQAIVIYFWVFG